MKCDELQERWFEAYPVEGDQIIPTRFDYARSTRHMNKWLELAEKFKPNSTAQ